MKDLLFVIGRIRALEGKSATLDQFERMVDAPTPEEAFSVLSELEYAEHLTPESRVEDYPELIDTSLTQARKLINNGEIFPEMKLLWLKYDLGNLKSGLNYVRAEEEIPEFTRENGFEPMGDLSQAELVDVLVNNKANPAVPPIIFASLEKAKNAESDTQADFILTSAYFKQLKDLAKKYKNPFIKRYVSRHIDSENIRSLSRGILTLKRKLTADEFHSGGTFDFDQTASLEYYEDLAHFFRATPYEKTFPEKTVSDPEMMAKVELNLIRDYYEFLKQEEYGASDSLQIPLSYFEKFLHQSNLVRYVFVGKLSGIPKEMIKSRIANLSLS